MLIDFLLDFERYFTASPKAATLDPLENFRVNRGVRPFQQLLKKMLKSIKHAFENEVKTLRNPCQNRSANW